MSSWRTKQGQGGDIKADTKAEAQKTQEEIDEKLGPPDFAAIQDTCSYK